MENMKERERQRDRERKGQPIKYKSHVLKYNSMPFKCRNCMCICDNMKTQQTRRLTCFKNRENKDSTS